MQYEIKNWSKFQQYKDGRPMQWIKLHVGLLDDYKFDELDEIDQLNLIKLWLFAAKTDGKFEGGEKFIASKIGAKKLNINNLLHTGFIVRTDLYESVPREEKRREEERREEERREEEKIISSKSNDAANILTQVNAILNSGFKPVDSNLKFIIARLEEGHDSQEIVDVVKMKHEEWKDSKMEKYLRPSTLFNAEKFNQYVGVLPAYLRSLAGELDWMPNDTGNVIEGEFRRG